jgi:hypothetical protein
MECEIKVRCIFWGSLSDLEYTIERDLGIVNKYTRQFAQVLVNGMLLYRCGCSEAEDMLRDLIDKENETAQKYRKMYEELRVEAGKSNG